LALRISRKFYRRIVTSLASPVLELLCQFGNQLRLICIQVNPLIWVSLEVVKFAGAQRGRLIIFP
jgi:hypothetical protein